METTTEAGALLISAWFMWLEQVACVCARACAFMRAGMRVHACGRVRERERVRVWACAQARAGACVGVCVRVQPCVCVCACARVGAWARVPARAAVCARPAPFKGLPSRGGEAPFKGMRLLQALKGAGCQAGCQKIRRPCSPFRAPPSFARSYQNKSE